MYGKYAGMLKDGMSTASDITATIDGIDFESNWSSEASTVLLEALNTTLDAINNLKTQLSLFESVLYLVDEYIIIVERIAELEKLIANERANPSLKTTETYMENGKEKTRIKYVVDQTKINAWQAEIAELEQKRLELRDKILGLLASITGIEVSEMSMVSYTGSCNFSELMDKRDQFNKLQVSGNLFEALTIKDENGNIIRDGEEYFNNTINSVRAMHTGTDKTFYTTLALIDLCLEAGVRPSYKHDGTGTGGVVTNDRRLRVAVPASAISSGSDCNAVASFLVFNDDSQATWLSTDEFVNTTDLYVDEYMAVSGDVCTKIGHVGIVLGYDSETDQYMVYEAKGYDEELNVDYGHQMTLMSGAAFRSKFNVSRIDSSYVPSWLQN